MLLKLVVQGILSPLYHAQRAKIAKKVHKPPLGVNVINFESNGFNASIWVPWSPSDQKNYNALIKVFKFI